MLSRRTLLAGLLVTAGLLAGGCGGSDSPFSGTSHPPAGFVRYRGSGYVLAVPARFQAKPGNVPDQPPGSTVTELTPGGAPVEKTNAEVLLLENPHLKFTLDQIVDNLERADRTNPALSDVQINTASASVPKARAARIVTERYVAPVSASNSTQVTFDRKWLMVLIKPGMLLDVVVVNAPKLGGRLNADAVIDSLRLDG